MLKLRVRHVSNNTTNRLEIPTTGTLADAQQLVTQLLGLHEEAVLSLNKKTAISTEGSKPLRDLGLCNGDVVWVLSPAVSGGPSASQSAQSVSGQSQQATLEPPLKRERPDTSSNMMDMDRASSNHAATTTAGTDPDRDAAAGVLAMPVGIRRAVLSPSWPCMRPSCRVLLLVDAAMAETGFQGLQDAASAVGAWRSGRLELVYACPALEPDAAPLSSATAAAGAGATPMEADAAAATSSSGAAGGGTSGACGAEQQQQQSAGPRVKLSCVQMAHVLVVYGVPQAAAAAPQVQQGQQRQQQQPVALHLDTMKYKMLQQGAAVAGGAASSDADAAAAGPPSGALLPLDLAPLWRSIKDTLCVPLLAALYRCAGLPPPLGLTVLPLELQVSILSKLQARELAALGSSCVSLQRLCCEDALWVALMEAEFGALTAADRAAAQHRGFKHAFARRWTERRERQQAHRRIVLHPPTAVPRPMPYGPLMRPPFMPPGAIGGDYDRLPMPLLGVGPGMFGGGRAGFGPGALGGGRGGGFGAPRQWGFM